MASIVVIYKTPKDPAAFDKYYAETHVPIAKKIPGLKRYELSRGPVSGASDVYLVAILTFDSQAAMQSALASPEAQTAGNDVPNFASGGVDTLIFDTKDA